MPTPTFSQWRSLSTPLPFAPDTLKERQLKAWATYVTGINPDGSNKSGVPTNLLSAEDSSFEAGTTGDWNTFVNATSANSTAQAFVGTHSLAATAVATGDMYVTFSVTTLVLAIPGSTYTYSAVSRPNTTQRPFSLFVQWFDVSLNYIGDSFKHNVNEVLSTWTTITSTDRSPFNAAYGRPIYYVAAPVLGEVHYLDNVFFGIV